MKKVVVFIIFGLMLVLASCRSRHSIDSTTTKDTTERVTITEKIVPIDTIVPVKGDTSSITATLEKLIASTERLAQKKGNSTVYLGYDPKTNRITADCECDSTAIKIRLYQSVIEILKERETKETSITQKTIDPKEKKTSVFVTILKYLIALSLIIFIGLITLKKIK